MCNCKCSQDTNHVIFLGTKIGTEEELKYLKNLYKKKVKIVSEVMKKASSCNLSSD